MNRKQIAEHVRTFWAHKGALIKRNVTLTCRTGFIKTDLLMRSGPTITEVLLANTKLTAQGVADCAEARVHANETWLAIEMPLVIDATHQFRMSQLAEMGVGLYYVYPDGRIDSVIIAEHMKHTTGLARLHIN